MQIEARIVFTEARNISLTVLCILKNIMAIISVKLGPKNIAFGNFQIQIYRTYLLVCDYAKSPHHLGLSQLPSWLLTYTYLFTRSHFWGTHLSRSSKN